MRTSAQPFRCVESDKRQNSSTGAAFRRFVAVEARQMAVYYLSYWESNPNKFPGDRPVSLMRRNILS